MSKLAAYEAGTYRDRDGVTGPETRVPMSAFLEDNGFVPSRKGPRRGATPGPSPISQGSPVADMSPGSVLDSIEGDVIVLDSDESPASVRIEEDRIKDLQVRVSQLEGVVHALQNTALDKIVDRVSELEEIVGDLKSKVGSGCDAEVAKMREVMGGLKAQGWWFRLVT